MAKTGGQFAWWLALNETPGHNAFTVMIMIEVAMNREACWSCGGSDSGSGVLVMTYAAHTGSVLMVGGSGSDGCSCGSDHVGGMRW